MRKRIIKWLGGYTKQQVSNLVTASAIFGRLSTLKVIKNFADDMNGTPGDEWAKEMYDYILNRIEYRPKIDVTFGGDEGDEVTIGYEEDPNIKEEADGRSNNNN